MRGSAAVFMLGMIVAAIVGIAAAFAMQTAMLDGFEATEISGSTGAGSGDVKIELANTEHRLQSQIKEIAANVEALTGNVERLRTEIQSISLQTPVAVGGSGETSAPVAATNLGSAINQVLDDRDKRREEERAQEREQRAIEMRDRFKEMMNGRTQRYAEEKGWDAGKTDQVKQVMGDYYTRMSEISPMGFMGRRGGRGGDRGGTDETREQINQLREDTKSKLLQLVSEEEANELLQSGFGGGRGGRPGGGGRGR